MEQNQENLFDRFHTLEKKCISFENFIDCDDKTYIDTLEKLK